jgi:hypothetical protein
MPIRLAPRVGRSGVPEYSSMSPEAADGVLRLPSPLVAEDVVIRPERDADHAVIAEVARAAFVGQADDVASFAERIRASQQFIRTWRWSPRTPPV